MKGQFVGWERELRCLMQQFVDAGAFPSAVLGVAWPSGTDRLDSLLIAAGGAREDTVFDLASLTKPIVTTTLMMLACQKQLVSLDDPVERLVAGCDQRIRIWHLLRHVSGLPAWKPYYERLPEGNFRRAIIEWIAREELLSAPGTQAVYSDLGFILLGALLEEIFGDRLDRLARQLIFTLLGMNDSFYVEVSPGGGATIPSVPHEQIAPTENCPWRKRLLRGEVHDDNAWAMGGVAPHAGLFAAARDVLTFADAMCRSYLTGGEFVSQGVARSFLYPRELAFPCTWRLGWDSPTPDASSAGHNVPREAVGHLGFTGCSLWLVPGRRWSVVLLTNRVHPCRSNNAIREARPRIHEQVWQMLSDLDPSARSAGV